MLFLSVLIFYTPHTDNQADAALGWSHDVFCPPSCRESYSDVGRGAEGPGVWCEAEGRQRVFCHAEGGAQRKLCQLRGLPSVRRRRTG